MKKPAIILEVKHPTLREYDSKEIKGLAETAGYTVIYVIKQKTNRLNSRFFLGIGKVKQISEVLEHLRSPPTTHEKEKNEMFYEDDLFRDEEIEKSREEKEREELEKTLLEYFKENREKIESLTFVFNNRLGYMQILNLQKEWRTEHVLDRDLLVLEIFEKHARTQENKLQIELARMALQTNLIKKELGQHLSEKQGMGHMGKGMPGWAPIARAYTKRKKKIIKDLEKIASARMMRRKGRKRYFNLGIAGYTNAGKTSLLNILAKERLEAEDKEFTTINPVSRRVQLPPLNYIIDNIKQSAPSFLKDTMLTQTSLKTSTQQNYFKSISFIATDSVGFIENLSPLLINAFLSTLEEILFSNLIAIVVDISEEKEERILKKIESSFEIMKEIGAQEIEHFLILNKIDKISEETLEQRYKLIKEKYPHLVLIPLSSKTGKYLSLLYLFLYKKISQFEKHEKPYFPSTKLSR